MHSPLPIGSYVFVLRKHKWLVLAVVLAAMGGGVLYVKAQLPVFRAIAKVEIKTPSADPGRGETTILREDPSFLPDQYYRIRNDLKLASAVLGQAKGAPDLSREEGEYYASLRPAALLGMVKVERILMTSYFELAIDGPVREADVRLANAYAEKFAEFFRKDREDRFREFEAEFAKSRDEKEREIKGLLDQLDELQRSHPEIDFIQKVNVPGEAAGLQRKALSQRLAEVRALEEELRTIEAELQAVGLEIVGEEGQGASLQPGFEGTPEEDPRLSSRIQSMEVIRKDSNVGRFYLQMDRVLESDYSLLQKSYDVNSPERKALESKRQDFLGRIAVATESAITELSRRVVQGNRTLQEWGKQVDALEAESKKVALALIDQESIIRKLDEARARLKEYDERLQQGARERARLESMGQGNYGSVRVYEPARLEDVRLVKPNKLMLYAMVFGAALVLGAALAYILEFMDDTVKTREDFDRLVRLPFLGFVPRIRSENLIDRDLIVVKGKTGTAEVESFRSIRTAIQFCRPNAEVHTLLISSAGPNEGKTTVALNLAATFAAGQARVLIVDADLRRARIHKALGVNNAMGLTNVLVGTKTMHEVIQKTNVKNLDILSSGPIPPNPADLLGSAQMKVLLKDASAVYDRVVIDSPPIAAVTDPALLATFVDGIFLVISVGKTSMRMIHRAKEALAAVGCEVHGAILNNSEHEQSGYYYGYYKGYEKGYGYGRPAEEMEGMEALPVAGDEGKDAGKA